VSAYWDGQGLLNALTTATAVTVVGTVGSATSTATTNNKDIGLCTVTDLSDNKVVTC
jgi:hypothetical protein